MFAVDSTSRSFADPTVSLKGWHEDRVVPRLAAAELYRRHGHLSTFGFRGFEVATGKNEPHKKNASNTINAIALFAPAVAASRYHETMQLPVLLSQLSDRKPCHR